MSNKLDHQTILGFQQGDAAAFELVFKAYYTPIVFFANKLIDNLEEAEDIVIQIFNALHERYDKFSDEINIKAFLYVSARNRCLNYLKAKKRQDTNRAAFAKSMDNDTLLEFEYNIKPEIYEAIHRAIEELPRECGKIFKMLYYEDLKPAEVAALLQISVNTVYVQKTRAISALRLKLSENALALAVLANALALLQLNVINPASNLNL